MPKQWNGNSGTPIKLRTNAPRETEERGPIRYRQPQQRVADDENPKAWTPARSHTSAVRYVDTRGNTIIRQGNRQIVFHDEPAPKGRRPHWFVISGLTIIVVVLFIWFVSWLSSWWTNNQLNATYEFPRISQTDAVVYPEDTQQHPSHYLFLNLQGTVLIVEFPHGDSTHAKIYKGPTIFSENADQVPVTGEFSVVNGKVEMLVHIQDRIILYTNNGTQFIPQ